MKVFVSYTRTKDRRRAVTAFVEKFARRLKKSRPRSKVFQDTKDIAPGKDLKQTIRQELDDADVLLILVSPGWLKSKWCCDEYRWFRAKKTATGELRFILPVLWLPTPELIEPGESRIAKQLKRLRYVDWTRLRPTGPTAAKAAIAVKYLAEGAVEALKVQDRMDATKNSVEPGQFYATKRDTKKKMN